MHGKGMGKQGLLPLLMQDRAWEGELLLFKTQRATSVPRQKKTQSSGAPQLSFTHQRGNACTAVANAFIPALRRLPKSNMEQRPTQTMRSTFSTAFLRSCLVCSAAQRLSCTYLCREQVLHGCCHRGGMPAQRGCCLGGGRGLGGRQAPAGCRARGGAVHAVGEGSQAVVESMHRVLEREIKRRNEARARWGGA
eukprot:scaffold118502_cov19-Tisochrysis_lutea.AAC.1